MHGHRVARVRRRGVAIVACIALGVGACSAQSPSAQESDLADRLHDELAAQGVDVATDTLVALFGDDGGHLCLDAEQGSAYIDFALVSHRFALRKTSVDMDDIEFARAVVDVYCPDERRVFDEFVDSLDVNGSA